MSNSTQNNFPSTITALWTVFLLGTLFHTQLALMPLFHGMSVVESHTHDFMSVNAVMWFMLFFFSLPLLAIVGCAFLSSQRFRQLHLIMTLIYTVLNLIHLTVDMLISVPYYQLVLMTLLLLIGLLLNVASYQWVKHNKRAANHTKYLR